MTACLQMRDPMLEAQKWMEGLEGVPKSVSLPKKRPTIHAVSCESCSYIILKGLPYH